MKSMVCLAILFGGLAVFAVPATRDEVVAEGFQSWQGVSSKNYLMGREICPADLRHKVTVVVEIEPRDDLRSQLLRAGAVAGNNPLIAGTHFGENWETRTLPRNVIVLISVCGGGKDVLGVIKEALKPPENADQTTVFRLGDLKSVCLPMYRNVTFAGGPKTMGKRPYVYVLGHRGKEVLFEDELNEKSEEAVRSAIKKASDEMSAEKGFDWVPFYGSVAEEARPSVLVQALEKGKTAKTLPVDSIEKALRKGLLSKDPDKSRDAQIVCDAIEQTRSDLIMRIKMEYGECPHRAVYDLQQLLKYWPGEKKRLDAISAKLKEDPETVKLAQMYCKVMVWADPSFVCKNAGEAKKIVGEIGKMRKDLGKLKESKTIVVQNGALLMEQQLDDIDLMMSAKTVVK